MALLTEHIVADSFHKIRREKRLPFRLQTPPFDALAHVVLADDHRDTREQRIRSESFSDGRIVIRTDAPASFQLLAIREVLDRQSGPQLIRKPAIVFCSQAVRDHESDDDSRGILGFLMEEKGMSLSSNNNPATVAASVGHIDVENASRMGVARPVQLGLRASHKEPQTCQRFIRCDHDA